MRAPGGAALGHRLVTLPACCLLCSAVSLSDPRSQVLPVFSSNPIRQFNRHSRSQPDLFDRKISGQWKNGGMWEWKVCGVGPVTISGGAARVTCTGRSAAARWAQRCSVMIGKGRR